MFAIKGYHCKSDKYLLKWKLTWNSVDSSLTDSKAHCDLPRLHLLHETCWVDSTLGSPDWTVRLNAYTLHVVPAGIMQYLDWGELFYPRFFIRLNFRTYFIIPSNEQYKYKLRWFSAAYIFKPLSFFLMHFYRSRLSGILLLFLIYI